MIGRQVLEEWGGGGGGEGGGHTVSLSGNLYDILKIHPLIST